MNLFRFKLDDDFFPGISANAAIPGYRLSNPFGIAISGNLTAVRSQESLSGINHSRISVIYDILI